ncbi:MAG TPA: hypothetical protein ACFYEC_00495 [Candidatus Brocadiaceae bacterium]
MVVNDCSTDNIADILKRLSGDLKYKNKKFG